MLARIKVRLSLPYNRQVALDLEQFPWWLGERQGVINSALFLFFNNALLIIIIIITPYTYRELNLIRTHYT